MTVASTFPTVKSVRNLLVVLLGRDAAVAPGDLLTSGPFTIEALYVDDRLQMGALIVADLQFAAYAGAAIGLLPSDMAEDAVETGELGGRLRENLAEVFNVMATLVNQDDLGNLRLYTTYPVEVSPPPDVRALAGAVGRRIDLDVDISGYGHGALAVILR